MVFDDMRPGRPEANLPLGAPAARVRRAPAAGAHRAACCACTPRAWAVTDLLSFDCLEGQPVKVLLVNNFVRHGSGVDRIVSLEQTLLTEDGHDVDLVARDNVAFDSAPALTAAALGASCLYSWGVRREVTARLSGGAVDVVHVHNTVPLLTGAVYDALRRTPALVVAHLHDYRAFCPAATAFRRGAACDLCMHSWFLGCVAYRCYRGSAPASAGLTTARLIDAAKGRRFGASPHVYVACSRHVRDEHVARGLPAARIAVVHNGIADPDPDGRRRALVRAPKRKLTYVGSLLAAKGVRRLPALAAALPDFEIHVIGTGPELPWLRAAKARERLGNLMLHGFMDGAAKLDLWADSLLTVVPSLWAEPFCLVGLESYALGVPVAATAAGGNRELVDDGRTGMIVDFSDAAAVARRIRALGDDEPARDALRRAARAAFEERFRADVFGRNLVAAFEQLSEARR
jgi:glycosyltransferase involved in cell wall biosynthesis